MDLKLIDVINVSHMFYKPYLLQILPAFWKLIVKGKENGKTKIVNFVCFINHICYKYYIGMEYYLQHSEN